MWGKNADNADHLKSTSDAGGSKHKAIRGVQHMKTNTPSYRGIVCNHSVFNSLVKMTAMITGKTVILTALICQCLFQSILHNRHSMCMVHRMLEQQLGLPDASGMDETSCHCQKAWKWWAKGGSGMASG